MINIKIIDNNDIFEIVDNKVRITNASHNLSNKMIEFDERTLHDWIIQIIRITDSWKKQWIEINDFENWEITIKLDKSTRTYSCKNYSNYDFDNIRNLIDKIIRRCI